MFSCLLLRCRHGHNNEGKLERNQRELAGGESNGVSPGTKRLVASQMAFRPAPKETGGESNGVSLGAKRDRWRVKWRQAVIEIDS